VVATVPVAFVGGYFLATTGAAIALLGLTFATLQNAKLSSALGAVLATRAVASFAALAGAGWLVARSDPKRALMVIQVLYALTLSMLAFYLLIDGSLAGVLFVAMVLLGILDGFFIPVNSAFIRGLAEGDGLTRINALVATSASTSKVSGAAVGGILLAVIAPASLLLVSVGAHLVHLIAIGATRVEQIEPSGDEKRGATHSRTKGALVELRQNPWIVAIAAQATLINVVAWSPYVVIGPQLSSTLYDGPPAWAALSAAYGVGAVAAGVGLTWKPPRSFVRAIVVAFPLWCLPLFSLAAQLPLGVSLVGAVAAGAGTSLFNVAWASVLQQRVARSNLTQVVSWVSVGPQVVAPLGLLVAGTFQTPTTQAAALGIGASIAAAGALTLGLLPMVRRIVRREVFRS